MGKPLTLRLGTGLLALVLSYLIVLYPGATGAVSAHVPTTHAYIYDSPGRSALLDAIPRNRGGDLSPENPDACLLVVQPV